MINRIHNTLRQGYEELDVATALLRQATPTTHIQSTPQQIDGWTCGLHMLLINLTTNYLGRIPALTHAQHHAESLSRSHLKYILAGELDTYVTNLIHDLTSQPQLPPKTTRTRHTTRHRLITTTCNKHSATIPTPITSCKRPYALTQTPPPNQPTPH